VGIYYNTQRVSNSVQTGEKRTSISLLWKCTMEKKEEADSQSVRCPSG